MAEDGLAEVYESVPEKWKTQLSSSENCPVSVIAVE